MAAPTRETWLVLGALVLAFGFGTFRFVRFALRPPPAAPAVPPIEVAPPLPRLPPGWTLDPPPDPNSPVTYRGRAMTLRDAQAEMRRNDAADTVTLPPGWTMDVPEGWTDVDTGRRERDPAAEAADPPGTHYYRAADGMIHKQLPPLALDAEGQRVVVEFNASRAARQQAQNDMREAVREELERDRLLNDDLRVRR